MFHAFESIHYWLVLSFTVLLFWLLPKEYRTPFLACVSFGYVFSIQPTGVFSIAIWVFLFFFFSRQISQGKEWTKGLVPVAVISIVFFLCFYKYIPFLLAAWGIKSAAIAIVIPVGLSFIAFRLIHYIIESSRNQLPPFTINDFIAYAFFFPIWIYGPIQRFDRYLNEQENTFNREHLFVGLKRIFYGLAKNFIIIHYVLEQLYGNVNSPQILLANLDQISSIEIWRYLGVHWLIHYIDFSAYSDIAIGSAQMFGIKIMENFKLPLLAKDISDFWRRWHLSLSNWCQTYIYMPIIAHTRNPWLAVYGTFLVMGLWHPTSWQWILWGIYHATGVSIFRLWNNLYRRRKWTFANHRFAEVFGRVITILFVVAAGSFTALVDIGTVADSFRVLAKTVFISY
ncbi:MBOAT family protein [Iningainema tapete]|uniref:MBOAT family protein n=1 Tax=Iningainema tapete BLCC-T55 TaxID=2748662 RepID=A0A8J6XKR6_9CYAN|nr:MBOAT family protein [Iningainema tapete]MBD2774461.1 MBOAT family protein [Iningainema tapete BLCC-T55]